MDKKQLRLLFERVKFDGEKFDDLAKELNITKKEVSELYAQARMIWKDEILIIDDLRGKFHNKKKIDKDLEVFRDFYDATKHLFLDGDSSCFYCGVTQEQIRELLDKKALTASRNGKRGISLEIERLKPDESYLVKENNVLACYWCNNAKSDHFGCYEFKAYVAPGIRAIWNRRLSSVGLSEIKECTEKIKCPDED